jgi:hypothetical protein
MSRKGLRFHGGSVGNPTYVFLGSHLELQGLVSHRMLFPVHRHQQRGESSKLPFHSVDC